MKIGGYFSLLVIIGLMAVTGGAVAAGELKAVDAVVNSTGMKLVYIPAGEFEMGSMAGESGRGDDEVIHRVRLTRSFRMGATEVTQRQWEAVMAGAKSYFKGEDLPVESVSWEEAVSFCEKLSEKEGKKYRLPTEAEWEYACRAGSKGAFGGSGNIDEMGWYAENSEGKTHPVGSKKANAWGLYDMHGNVSEWCGDNYLAVLGGNEQVDPCGVGVGNLKVVRGGGWKSFAAGGRCAARWSMGKSHQVKVTGFRVVMEIAESEKDMKLFKIGACDWTIGLAADANSPAMAAKLGLDGVQVDVGRKGDELVLSDGQVQKKFLAMAKKHKIEIASLAICELNNVALKKEALAEKWVEQTIEICEAMGVKVILIPFFGNGDLRGDTAGVDVVVARLKRLAPKAEKAGVVLGIETTLSAKEHIDIIKRVGSPAVKVYYDVHNSTMNGYDIFEEIRYLGKDNLCEFHAKDDKDLYGKGRIDFVKVREAMDSIGWRGWIQIEGWKTPLGFEESYRYDGEYLHSVFTPNPQAGLANTFFAMDTGTIDANHVTAASQVEMLEELGYAGICYWQRNPQDGISGTKEMLGELDNRGMKAFSFYFNVNLSAENKYPPLLKETIALLKGRDSMLWLSVSADGFEKSSPEGDALAVATIREIADAAEAFGVKVALYPHAGSWMERVEDAVAVAKKVGRKNVGVCFNLCHWLISDEEANMERVLKLAAPYLFAVTINGADSGGRDWGALIKPLDTGTFDMYKFLKVLKELGYTGAIGLQGYGIQGDVYENLRRSMGAWRKLSGRFI